MTRETHLIFHLAIPCLDLDKAEDFYSDKLGFQIARKYNDRVTFNMFGDQLVCHLSSEDKIDKNPLMYPRHFGFTFFKKRDFNKLYAQAVDIKLDFYSDLFVRWEGKPEEHSSFFLCDPSNNLLEFKFYSNREYIY